MSISGVGGAMGAQQKAGGGAVQSPEQTFLSYVKKSPVERWIESWLAAHGLTKDAFDALPADRHDALAREMAEDLKKAAQQRQL